MLCSMTEVSISEFEKEFESYMDRIEAGEKFLIRQPDGKAVVAVPADELSPLISSDGEEDWYNMMTEHNDAP
ncbi:PhDYefM tox-ant domain [Synechococcus phage S-PM2]|uniref:PhDYefM tox-ant domain n=1 Tax=Synechococcus phage S-PM2 TaxID=238854 RepID=Q5GQH4_BPSYP|nr:Phd-like antitoxin [Synechococcus phage S-PM2]CAF34228.1 PhDYefM tox-ant domain [Synechococcus phage S-PM2]CFW42366.1 PhDYefM tox-ant domain [Synechococcus phage S-PM2]